MDPTLPFKLQPKYVAKAKSYYNEIACKHVENDGGLSKLVYIRTYSRNVYDDNKVYIKNETIFDTWVRNVNGVYSLAKQKFPRDNFWDEEYWQGEAYTMLKLFISKKISPPGRGLWNLGTPLIHSKQIGMALFNCAFISSANIDIIGAEYFCFIMYGLMVGSGVGLDDAGSGKVGIKQPRPSNFKPCASVIPLCEQLRVMADASKKITPSGKKYLDKEIKYMQNVAVYHPNQYDIFKIPDDRAGWVEAMRRLLNSYFKGNYITLFDYSDVRPQGEYLITSGGVASGPQPLAEALAIIRYRLQKNIGKKMDSVLIVDIANIIGMMVIAGNIRRSSQIFCFNNLEMADIKKMFVNKLIDGRNVIKIIPKHGKMEYIGRIKNGSDKFVMNYKDGELTEIITNFSVVRDQDLLNIYGYSGELVGTVSGADFFCEMEPYKKYEYRTMREAWSGNSNNSFIIDDDWDDEEFSKILDRIVPMIDQTSEPGILNIKLCRKYGRIADGPGDHDPLVDGVNPCGEITLQGMRKDGKDEGDIPYSAGGELCCISEINASLIESEEDFIKSARYATFIAKMMCTVRIEWKATDEIQHKNYRIGVSQTGIIEYLAKTKYDFDAYARLCDAGYKAIRRYDEEISKLFCIPQSIKVTAIKPSGTLGLLLGTTSGMHGPWSEFSIRRVRFSKSSKSLYDGLVAAGYHVEDDIYNSNSTAIVSIPVRYAPGIKTKKNITLHEQFELLRILQTYWSDNAVSVTIFYREGELDELRSHLMKYRHVIKCASFSKYFDTSNTQYKQLPQEEISEKEYYRMISEIRPISIQDLLPKYETVEEEVDNMCDGEKCSMR